MTNEEKFYEVFGNKVGLTPLCECTDEEISDDCYASPYCNLTSCPLWLKAEYKEVKQDENLG